jgi:hypothetical protein
MRQEWASERGLRQVYEKTHGKIFDARSTFKFVCVTGLLTAMIAAGASGFQLHVPLVVNAILIGILLGGLASFCQVLFLSSAVNAIADQTPRGDLRKLAAIRLVLLQTVAWVAALVVTGIWVADQTSNRGETFIWLWIIRRR